MNILAKIWDTPETYLAMRQPDQPVYFFNPAILQAKAREFLKGFNGLVTFAVKANPDPAVISNLVSAGIRGFDVASPTEIRLIRNIFPDAVLHYNNPARSGPENAFAYAMGVRSFSVDCLKAVDSLLPLGDPSNIEISVRLKLPVKGAVYDFGSKFGADPKDAEEILRHASAKGFAVSMTFHPGTQCEDKAAWETYISQAAAISERTGIALERLNVGGGFPAPHASYTPDLKEFFEGIDNAVNTHFPHDPPLLVCEPGRAMVAESFAHSVQVKDIRDNGAVYLNDGIYGGLSEFPSLPVERKLKVLSMSGEAKAGTLRPMTLFGPTCDSLDRLPGQTMLPESLQDGDYIIWHNMGAYLNGVSTRFNGYGEFETVPVLSL